MPIHTALLAMLGALQRMGDGDERALSGKTPRQLADRIRTDAADRGGPFGVLGLPVALAGEIAQEDWPAFGVAIEEGLVVQVLADQRMDDAEHQGGVGTGHATRPFGAGLDRQIVAQRADQDELAAARPRRRHGAALDMLADRAAGHHGILQRHAAECQHDLGVISDLLPGDVALGDVLVTAEDLRQQHRGRARGIGVDRAHVAAHRDVEEAMHLALGVMEAACTRPAIGAAEHGVGSARVADAAQLLAEQVEHLLPAHRHEFVAAAAIVGARPALEPAAANRRLGDARLVAERAGKIVDDAVRIGVARIGPDLEPGRALTGGEHAPMRGVRLEAVRQVETGVGKANRIVHRLILVPLRPAIGVVIYRSAPDVVEISVDGNACLPRAKSALACGQLRPPTIMSGTRR
ncbi:hypothetical protein ACVIIV_003610 [Bradyrhizobium sp. USDA 4354]